MRFLVGNFVDIVVDSFDVLLESHLKHLVGLIETDALDALEVDFFPFEEINKSARGGNNDIDFGSEEVQVFSDLDSSVQGDDIVLFGVELEAVDFVGDLDAEFSGGQDDEELDVIALEKFLMSEPFDDGEGIGDGLAAASSVSADEVLTFVDGFKGHVLDGEKVLDVFFMEDFDHSGVLDEVIDVFLGLFGLFWLRVLHVGVGGDDVSGHHLGGEFGDKIKNAKQIKKGSFIWEFGSSM